MRQRSIILSNFWTRILCPDRYGCGTGVRETVSGRAHTKSPKKMKELLQEHHVAQPERRLWPVVGQRR